MHHAKHFIKIIMLKLDRSIVQEAYTRKMAVALGKRVFAVAYPYVKMPRHREQAGIPGLLDRLRDCLQRVS